MENIVYVSHRINTIEELRATPKEYGVEVDIRDFGKNLVLQHDPYKSGELFETYLRYYDHSFIILNIKSEGIELKILELLNKFHIDNYFFLDSSFPMIYKLLKWNVNVAIRLSEFEGMDTLRRLNRPVFVWVDCFENFPLSMWDFTEIVNMGMQICYVSPELQNRPEDILKYKKFILDNKMIPSMICCKENNIKEWKY